MKRALVIFAVLGALVWSAQVALIIALTQPQSGTLATAQGYLLWIVPALGLLVGIVGAVHAGRSSAARWMTFFIILAVLIVALLVLGFLVVIVVFVLTFDTPNQTLNAVGTIGWDFAALFPIVMFVTALVYALRGATQPDKAAGEPSPV
jgi:hypothetical protein